MDALPVDSVLPDLVSALERRPNAVLVAPPGAGKTTRVPLALLDAPWRAGGRLVVLEPRRLAARAAAQRMAETLGEDVGRTVGYTIRMDSRTGPETAIEVVTEGVLTRRLQGDPELGGVAAVLFDEFHERSLHADLGLALCLEAQGALREDLRLLVMSATLDAAPVAALMGDAPVIESSGRAHPVEIRHIVPPAGRRVEESVAAAVRLAMAEEPGGVLAFLPGEAEIRRTAERLSAAGLPQDVDVLPLYGAMALAAQRAAIAPPSSGRRKVVLATSIAETSLTIDGVRVVVDGGLMRVPRFDPRSAMTRLETVRVSQAAAAQRCGRAGRTAPGVCYRLWAEAESRGLVPFTAPEILSADLAPLALELALWGAADPGQLAWLDAPPAAAYAQARELLSRLGALDGTGAITAHGRAMGRLGTHPRLAHMLLAAEDPGLAAEIAAVLDERDILAGRRDPDLRVRIEALRHGGAGLHRGAASRAREAAKRLARRLNAPPAGSAEGAGAAVALAYPDRVARRRGGEGRYRLANGRGAALDPAEPLAAHDFLAVADLGGGAGDARIFLAAPLTREEIEQTFVGSIETGEEVAWDPRAEAVRAVRVRRLGAVVLDETPLSPPPAGAAVAAMCDGVRRLGIAALPWTKGLETWRARVAFLRRAEGTQAGWPDLSDDALLDSLDDWLAPFLDGVTRRAHLARVDLKAALEGFLGWELRQRLEREAPTHLTVPSGQRRPLDYDAEDGPVLAVRLQEMFGCAETPRVAGGRVAVLIHLLSPAGRPVQVTRDLAGFWNSGYAAVRADLRGRYPKHPWPDDPMAAEPTHRAKRRKE